jgi:hypothetical protein
MADSALTIEHASETTEAEAAAILSEVFAEPGKYLLTGPAGFFGIELSSAASDARDPLALWQALFPADGVYVIKAAGPPRTPSDEPPPVPKRLPRWWLEAVLSDAMKGGLRIRDLFAERIGDLVAKYGGALTSPAAQAELEDTLADFRLAIKWTLGHPLPASVERRLRALKFTDAEIIQFPGLGYRLGMIEAELAKRPDLTLDEILKLARAVPLNPADESAIAHATVRAGDALTPALLRDPERILADVFDRERALLRTMTPAAVKHEIGAREFARDLYRALSPEGVVRDFDRVARTELHEARVRGAFAADQKVRGWTPSTQVFRTLAAVPCNACLMLYKTGEGMPRLYTVSDLEEQDAAGYNRGPIGSWHARIGSTHPNCLCSPWVKWWPEMKSIYEADRPKWLAAMKRRGLGG